MKLDVIYKWASSNVSCLKSGDLLYSKASDVISLTKRRSHWFMECIHKCQENKTPARPVLDLSVIILLGISLQSHLTIGWLKLCVNWLLEPAAEDVSRRCG